MGLACLRMLGTWSGNKGQSHFIGLLTSLPPLGVLRSDEHTDDKSNKTEDKWLFNKMPSHSCMSKLPTLLLKANNEKDKDGSPDQLQGIVRKKGGSTRLKAKHHTGALHQNNSYSTARIFSCYSINTTTLQKLVNCLLGAGCLQYEADACCQSGPQTDEMEDV